MLDYPARELKEKGGYRALLKEAAEKSAIDTFSIESDFHYKSLAKARKNKRLSDEKLLEIAKNMHRKSLDHHIESLADIKEGITLLESAIKDIDFVLTHARHPGIKNAILYSKKRYEDTLTDYKINQIPYHSKQLQEKTDAQLLVEIKKEIEHRLTYHPKQMKEEKLTIKNLEKRTQDSWRLVRLLDEKKSGLTEEE